MNNFSSDVTSDLSEVQENADKGIYTNIRLGQQSDQVRTYSGEEIAQPTLNKSLANKLSTTTSSFDKHSINKQNLDQPNKTATDPAQQFVTLANALVAKQISLSELSTKAAAFSTAEWTQLLGDLFQATQTAAMVPELQQAIAQFAAQARNRPTYYLQIVEALLEERSIDLEMFATLDKPPHIVVQSSQSHSLGQVTTEVKIENNVTEKDAIESGTGRNREQATQNQVQQIESQEIVSTRQLNNQVDFDSGKDIQQPALNKPSSVQPLFGDKDSLNGKNLDQPNKTATDSAQQFVTLANALVAKQISLSELSTKAAAFSTAEWTQLLGDLFQATQAAAMVPELQQAIAQFAAQAHNRPAYYLQIVEALLEERSIDLEAFAADDNLRVADSAQLQKSQREKQYLVSQGEPQEMTHQQDQRDSDLTVSDVPQGSVQKTFIQSQASAAGTTHQPASQLSQDSIQNAMQSRNVFAADNADMSSGKLLLTQLLAQENPGHEQQLLLRQRLNTLLHKSSASLNAEWLQALALPAFCARLIHTVPAHLLHQLCNHLQPRLFTPLEQMVKLASDALALLMPQIDQLQLKLAKWEFIFQQLFTSGIAISDRTQLVRAACLHLAAHARFDDIESLVQLAERRLVLVKPVAQLKPVMSLKDLGLESATESGKGEDWAAGLSINNAGQVLVASFLPRLFSMLELTSEGKFIHPGAADRAAHLVQFVVNGQMETPEYEMTLNKILCGISTSLPISAGISVTEQERALVEQMLTSMIQHWKALGSTSIAGLRETFLQRQGWLVLEEDCWRLKVQERSFDMLLDRLPWSIALTKHGWMDKPLRVSWRNHS